MSLSDLHKYFKRKSYAGGIALIIVGILLSYSTHFTGAYFSLLIFIPVIILGIFLLFHNSKVSDSAMDEYCSSLANEYVSTVKSSYTDEVDDLILSYGYSFDNAFSSRTAIKGKDGKMRSSILNISVLVFSKDKITHFNRKYSLVSSEFTDDQSYFDKDSIAMVSVEQNSYSSAVIIKLKSDEKIVFYTNNQDEAVALSGKLRSK